MAISGFGNTKPCLSVIAGILTRNKSKVGRKILCRRKTLKITNLDQSTNLQSGGHYILSNILFS